VVLLYPNLNNGQMTANPDIATKVVYEMATHKAQAVIFIRFEYDASLIARVKKLVGVRWSQSQKAWYVLDTQQYRQRFGLGPVPLVEQLSGKAVLVNLKPTNRAAMQRFVETLQLKAYSRPLAKGGCLAQTGDFSAGLRLFFRPYIPSMNSKMSLVQPKNHPLWPQTLLSQEV
jgi:hypothetical protein